jgi:hypothetical protein
LAVGGGCLCEVTILLRRLSPLLTPDSLHQIKRLQAAACPDVVILDRLCRAMAGG